MQEWSAKDLLHHVGFDFVLMLICRVNITRANKDPSIAFQCYSHSLAYLLIWQGRCMFLNDVRKRCRQFVPNAIFIPTSDMCLCCFVFFVYLEPTYKRKKKDCNKKRHSSMWLASIIESVGLGSNKNQLTIYLFYWSNVRFFMNIRSTLWIPSNNSILTRCLK